MSKLDLDVKQQHTPGDWRVCPGLPNLVVSDVEGRTVIVGGSNTCDRPAEAGANAAMFAAAPAMLDALIQAYARAADDVIHGGAPREADRWAGFLCGLIARATGAAQPSAVPAPWPAVLAPQSAALAGLLAAVDTLFPASWWAAVIERARLAPNVDVQIEATRAEVLALRDAIAAARDALR